MSERPLSSCVVASLRSTANVAGLKGQQANKLPSHSKWMQQPCATELQLSYCHCPNDGQALSVECCLLMKPSVASCISSGLPLQPQNTSQAGGGMLIISGPAQGTLLGDTDWGH
jgi:hypothetical protein